MDPAYTKNMADIQDRHWWYEGRRRILRDVIRRLRLPSSARILEAGCGPGGNLLMLQEFGTVEAFEPDDFARAHAGKKTGLSVHRGCLPGPLPDFTRFDLVGAFDVIEHIDDDAAALKTLHGLTKPGGRAVFTVPAYMFLWSRHDEVNHHKRRYTRAGLRKVLQATGYEVTFISHYNAFLFPAVVGVRLLKKILNLTDKPDETIPHSILNALLLKIFESEKFFLRLFPFVCGVSIIAVCRRPVSP